MAGQGVRVATVAAFALLVFAAGCTVRPLYATGPVVGSTAATPTLSQIAVKAPESREELEVRNHLLFLLNGGRGEPARPRYSLDLNVTRVTLPTAVRQITSIDQEPTAGAVTMTSAYQLTDNATGEVVARGRREITSSFDNPLQEFAAIRAERDAQDRAARELAELVRLALAQDLERLAIR